MQALVTVPGAPGGLEIREVPEPEPTPDEVVVQVEAFAINRGELRLLKARPDGWRPGQDVAGTVTRAASDGSGPPEPARVVAWPDQAGWAERVAVSADRVAVLPEDVPPTIAATLPIAGVTALRMLDLAGGLLGRRVLVTGAAGGVGRFLVELGAHAGARVTGVARSPERAEGLMDLGATHVVYDIGDAEGPFDVILESVGGASLDAAIERIAPRGDLIVFGNSSNETAGLEFGAFRGKGGARLHAFFVYETGPPSGFGRDLERLVRLVADERLHPEVGHEAPWQEVAGALNALAERRVRGKAVLTVG